MDRSRLLRAAHEDEASFDWQRTAQERGVPVAAASRAFAAAEARARDVGSHQVQALYLDELDALSASPPLAPGKRTLTMRRAAELGMWPGQRRPDEPPVAPGRRTRSSRLSPAEQAVGWPRLPSDDEPRFAPGRRTWTARLAGRLEQALEQHVDDVEVLPEETARVQLRARTRRDPQKVLDSLSSSGEPMLPEHRARFERAFGRDLSHVVVHADGHAASAAADLSAHAFAVGPHLYFGAGEYAPGTEAGDRLLAHELAHVVQWSRGELAGVTPGSVSAADSPAERAADALADHALDRDPPAAPAPVAGAARPDDGAPILRAEGWLNDSRLTVHVEHEGHSVGHDLDLSPAQAARFAADPALAGRFAQAVEATFRPGGAPVFESSRFLSMSAITTRLRQDVDGWLTTGALATTASFLAERLRTLRSLHFLHDLEQHLHGHGFEPGSVDWQDVLPGLLARPLTPAPTTLVEASVGDRYHLFLRALLLEATARPAVAATVSEARLAPLLRDYVERLPTASFGNAVSVHSEAFLAHWALELRGLTTVPTGFDVERHRPRTTAADVDAERDRVLADFEATEMPDLVVRYVMDDWARSGSSEEGYLAHLDVAAVRAAVIGQLTDDLVTRARGDARYRAVLRDAAHDQSRFEALRALVTVGRALDVGHDGLALRLTTTPATELGGFEREIAGDPFGYVQEVRATSDAMRGFLLAMQGGADFDQAWSTVAAPGGGRFAQASALIAVIAQLRAIRALRDEQTSAMRERLRARLDLGYPEIATAIRNRWEYADTYIRETYIPAVKQVALERVGQNRDELQHWLDNWGTQTPALAAQYRVGARVLGDIAGRLDSGEASSVELDGQTLDAGDVRHLRAAQQVFASMAEQLTSPEGQERKRQELRDAVGAYDRVRERILDGTYRPHEWGATVHEEARRRLGIGEFPAYTTYRQVFIGATVAGSNPFLARAIAGWQFVERLEAEFRTIAIFVGVGMLTVASLLVPGAAGVALMFLDLAVQVGMGIHGVVDARRTLDLALLDPHLDLHGVSVEQAREALHHAWVNLAVTALMVVGAVGLMGLVRFLGRGARQFGNLPHLQGALRSNPLAAERLMNIVTDHAKLNELLGLAGRVEHLETLFLHGSDVREVERVLRYVGDGALAARYVEGAQSVDRFLRVFARVGSAEELAGFANLYGNDLVRLERQLAALGADAGAGARLRAIITRAGGLPAMEGMLVHCDDLVQLERLLARFERGEELAALLARTRSGRHLTTLLEHTATAAELERLLTFFPTAERAAGAAQAAGSGATLIRILDRVPDLAAFDALATTYGNNLVKLEGHLAGLAADATATTRLQELLRRAGSLERMETMLGACDDIVQLERLTQRLENGEELAALIRQVGRGGRAEALLGQLPDVAAVQRLLATVGEGADLTAFWRLVDADGPRAVSLARALESSPGLVGRLATELGADALRVLEPGGNGVVIAGELDVSAVALARHRGDELRSLIQCCERPLDPVLAEAVAGFERNPLRYRFRSRVTARNQPWIEMLTRELGLAEPPEVLRNLTPEEGARLWDITGEGTRGANPVVRPQAARWALGRGGNARAFIADFQFYVGEVQAFEREMTQALDTLAQRQIAAETTRLGRAPRGRELEAIYQGVTGAARPAGLGQPFVNLTGAAVRARIAEVARIEMETVGVARADAAMARSTAELTGPNAPGTVGLGGLPATDAELVDLVRGRAPSLSMADGADIAYHAHVHNAEIPAAEVVAGESEVAHYLGRARDIVADPASTTVINIGADGSRSVIFSRGRGDVIVRVSPDGTASIATYMPAARRR